MYIPILWQRSAVIIVFIVERYYIICPRTNLKKAKVVLYFINVHDVFNLKFVNGRKPAIF